jgi:adenylate cyclase
VAAALATVLIGGYLASGWAAAALAALLLTIVALTQALFRAGHLLSASEMILSGSLALVATLVFRSLTAERRGAIFRGAIALFVGKKVARALDEYEAFPAGGSRQEVTILFSDIRGFTAFCEEKDPAVVVELLNEYLRTMVAIIVRHHGHANKFIGDGIMAIFSDEDGGAAGDHALRAVRCGMEMTRAGGGFRTGVGIHTGVALVGCVGSSDKMEFTALGDTVNLASRLESLNKEHKTQLLFSQATRERLGPEIETVCLGEVQIRGKTVPMSLYTAAEAKMAGGGAVAAAEKR